MVYETVVGRIKEDLEKFGIKATGYIGKHIVGTGEDAHLTTKVFIDLLRPHVILICGKRGCLTGDTMIFTDKGFKKIEKFDEEKDLVYSYNKLANSFEWKKAKLIKYKIDKREPLVKFHLDDGQTLIATSEHPFLTFNGNESVWLESKKFMEGDSVMTVTELPEVKNDSESERIARLLGFVLADDTISIRKVRRKDGRGYMYNGTEHKVRITNESEEVLSQANEDIEKEFKVKADRWKRKESNCEDITNCSSRTVKKLVELGVPVGAKSKKIRVPDIVWRSSNTFKANFLKALFSCDGYISKTGDRIEYYSNSRQFLLDLQLLLLHFGIQSKIFDKKIKLKGRNYLSYRLQISDYSSIENFKKIGFFDEPKNKRLQLHKFWRIKRRKGSQYFGNLFCQPIKTMVLHRGENEVYDLIVPGTHSFIANGVISHNSGKSYSAGTIVEEILSLEKEYAEKIACVVFDPVGIYWSMKLPNEQEIQLLKEWKLEPKKFDQVKVYVPLELKEAYEKAGIPVDYTISISPKDFSPDDWALAFNLERTSQEAITLERNFSELADEKKDFGIDDFVIKIKDDRMVEQDVKNILINFLEAAKSWGIFSEEGMRIEDIVKPGQVSVIDLSRVRGEAWGLRNLIAAWITRQIYRERVLARKEEELARVESRERKKVFPLTWLVLEESHNFIPSDQQTVSSEPIKMIAKQGREPGISLICITQMPAKIHQDVLSQCDIVISFRLTSKDDLQALHAVYQTYMPEQLEKVINNLPRHLIGSAIILDDNLEKVFSINVRPRTSWHSGGTAAIL